MQNSGIHACLCGIQTLVSQGTCCMLCSSSHYSNVVVVVLLGQLSLFGWFITRSQVHISSVLCHLSFLCHYELSHAHQESNWGKFIRLFGTQWKDSMPASGQNMARAERAVASALLAYKGKASSESDSIKRRVVCA